MLTVGSVFSVISVCSRCHRDLCCNGSGEYSIIPCRGCLLMRVFTSSVSFFLLDIECSVLQYVLAFFKTRTGYHQLPCSDHNTLLFCLDVLFQVDYNEAIFLWGVDKKDFLLWTITCITTLFLGIEIGVLVGVSTWSSLLC